MSSITFSDYSEPDLYMPSEMFIHNPSELRKLKEFMIVHSCTAIS